MASSILHQATAASSRELLIAVPAQRAAAWHSETANIAVMRNASAEAADEAAPALATKPEMLCRDTLH
jgi:hypothetical protein